MMKPLLPLLFVLLSGCFLSVEAQVKLDYYLPANTTYNPKVPTPEQFFGFQVGEWHLQPDQIVAYMRALDQASDRITLVEYARTHERRPLLLLTITSPENHKNIDTLKQQHRLLSDPSKSASVKIDDMPVFVWLGYSVHGNESSGCNAGTLVAYYLAAAEGAEIDAMLANTVILFDPNINPDGTNRFSHWANSHKGKNLVADPNTREHREVWPGGRTNHYWFDLNRDWLPLQHPESQGRLAMFHEWRPNVLTDHHEMGTDSTFFFQPGIPTRENPLVPRKTAELTAKIAEYHAQALNRIGSLYFTKESFDDFYIGKGSSYPDINGCVGILFEQGSSRGHLQNSVNGPLSFPATIRNHVTASFSTLRAAQAMRKDLLSLQRDFYATSMQEAEKAPIAAYVFGTDSDPARNFHFLEILRRHQINVYELGKDLTLDGKTFKAGSAYVVPTNQRQYRLITGMFEKRTKFEDKLFYDISSWTLPLAFGLPYAEVGRTAPAPERGLAVTTPVFPTGSVVGGKSTYAYAFEWTSYYAPRALNRLLKAGVIAKVAKLPFEIQTSEGKRKFDNGTILIPVGIQSGKGAEIDALLERAAKEDAIKVYALNTGLSSGGIDLGSNNFDAIKLPRVMLVVGDGVSFTDVGEAWHVLDQRMDIEVSQVDTTRMRQVDLNDYDVIVMVSGNYRAIEPAAVEDLKQWVGRGGTLIAQGSAVTWAINAKVVDERLKRAEGPKGDAPPAPRPFANAANDSGAQLISGAIFAARVDTTHPLGYGFTDSTINTFRTNTVFLERSRNAYSTPVHYGDSPLVSGYISDENAALIKNSAVAVVSRVQSGRVILMTDNPNFRAFWYGTNKLFLNGVFFGPAIRTGGFVDTENDEQD